MKINLAAILILPIILSAAISCKQNKLLEVKSTKLSMQENQASSVAVNGFSIGAIETGAYIMKLHNAFLYNPKINDDILSVTSPKPGYRFVYLDVSLRNKGNESVNGRELFTSLRVKDEKGKVYRKPGVALSVFCSENPGVQNKEEYNALWQQIDPGKFHRAIIYAVEVPFDINDFMLTIPLDKKGKKWKDIKFKV